MKQLSAVLQTIQPGAATPDGKKNISNTQPRGSTVVAGMTNYKIQTLPNMPPEAIDKELKAVAKSLPNLSITFREQSLFSNGEFIGVRTTPVITNSDHESLQTLYNITDGLCAPSGRELVMKEIYALSVVMARRKDEELDYKVLVSVYAQDLEEYPQDVVIDVCRDIRRTQKFFPTISDMRKMCGEKFEFRKSLLREIAATMSGGKYLAGI